MTTATCCGILPCWQDEDNKYLASNTTCLSYQIFIDILGWILICSLPLGPFPEALTELLFYYRFFCDAEDGNPAPHAG